MSFQVYLSSVVCLLFVLGKPHVLWVYRTPGLLGECSVEKDKDYENNI